MNYIFKTTICTVFAVILWCGIGGIEAQVDRQNVINVGLTCMLQTGNDRASVENAVRPGRCVRSQKSDCFMACMGQNLGLINSAGSLNSEAVTKMVTSFAPRFASRAGPIIAKCRGARGANTCDTAGAVIQCACKNFQSQ